MSDPRGDSSSPSSEAQNEQQQAPSETLNLDEQISKITRERDDYVDQLRRSQADFVNYQRRAKAQADLDRVAAIRPLANDLLGVIDNFERALSAGKAATGSDVSIVSGVEMVHKQLLDVLSRHGVQPIQALNKPFDPNLHEALAQKPTKDQPEGTVVEEYIKGYVHHDRVLRPSKVAVSIPAS